MLTLIEPKDHCFSKSRIDIFTELMKKYYHIDLSISVQNNSTFIIAEDQESGVYGGAQLHEKRVRSLPDKIRERIECFLPQDEMVWNCTVFLHLENEDTLSSIDDFEPFCWTFYRKLYDKLVEFGAKMGTGFLCMTLDPGEYLCTEDMGLWPYVLEVKTQESSDRLYHGILSLTGTQYETYKKKWKALDLSSQAMNLYACDEEKGGKGTYQTTKT